MAKIETDFASQCCGGALRSMGAAGCCVGSDWFLFPPPKRRPKKPFFFLGVPSGLVVVSAGFVGGNCVGVGWGVRAGIGAGVVAEDAVDEAARTLVHGGAGVLGGSAVEKGGGVVVGAGSVGEKI